MHGNISVLFAAQNLNQLHKHNGDAQIIADIGVINVEIPTKNSFKEAYAGQDAKDT
jgi:hypothetical protein